MHQLPVAFVAPLGAIIAALLAGLFSFLSLLISKENKVSEFRQTWIDALRADLAKYAASVVVLTTAQSWRKGSESDISWHDYLKNMQPVLDAASNAQMSIRLRVNPHDSDPVLRRNNEALLKKITGIQEAIAKDDFDEAGNLARTLHEQAAPVLKQEWKRVKQGEQLYRLSKWLAGAFVLVSLSGAVYLIATYVQTTYATNAANPSIEGTAAGKPASAPHVKR